MSSNAVQLFLKHSNPHQEKEVLFGDQKILQEIAKKTQTSREETTTKLALFFLQTFGNPHFIYPVNPLQDRIDHLEKQYQALFSASLEEDFHEHKKVLTPFYEKYPAHFFSRKKIMEEEIDNAEKIDPLTRTFPEFCPYLSQVQKKEMAVDPSLIEKLYRVFETDLEIEEPEQLGPLLFGHIALFENKEPLFWDDLICTWLQGFEVRSKQERRFAYLKEKISYGWLKMPVFIYTPKKDHPKTLREYTILKTKETLQLDCNITDENFRRKCIFYHANPKYFLSGKREKDPFFAKWQEDAFLNAFTTQANLEFTKKTKQIFRHSLNTESTYREYVLFLNKVEGNFQSPFLRAILKYQSLEKDHTWPGGYSQMLFDWLLENPTKELADFFEEKKVEKDHFIPKKLSSSLWDSIRVFFQTQKQ